MPHTGFNSELIDFVAASPTPFHAVSSMAEVLSANGFTRLNEADAWQLEAGGRYFFDRNGSSIIAFHIGEKDPLQTGLRLIGAHTDSPCLRVKPEAVMCGADYLQLGVEVYGGVLLNPWFDRDLSLAGRVSYVTNDGKLCSDLIDFTKAIAIIPNLAIHLDRDANINRSVNAQLHLPPLLGNTSEQQLDLKVLLLAQLQQQHPDCQAQRVLDYELSFYDVQNGNIVGLNNEFISCARLDNLLSCFVGMRSLLDKSCSQVTSILVCNDHEEVGSASAVGAQGPMLKNLLERMLPDAEQRVRVLEKSMMISADNAHGVHPNYADKHDKNHGPVLNRGPVLKINANQRYASNSETQAAFRYLAECVEVPLQSFVVRSDMACGSTIGPITATEIGVKTIDVGVPTFAMHSIRETAGCQDAWYLYLVVMEFFRREQLWAR